MPQTRGKKRSGDDDARSEKPAKVSKPQEGRTIPLPRQPMSASSVPTPATISRAVFASSLERYHEVVPAKLQELDNGRYETIPAAVAKRTGTSKKAHLTKDEAVKLLEWKLKHGTFRPALMGMMRQHTEETICDTTLKAFSQLDDPAMALKTLTALRGIGPATASLFLSCADPSDVPFFSDELYRWMMWDEPVGSGQGWERKIGYTTKEYAALLEKVAAFRKREGWADVAAVEMEKVAYVTRHG